MKHDSKINKNIWHVGIMSLILVFVTTFVAVVSPVQAAKSVSQTAISTYLAAQSNPALSDQQKIKAAIDAYFTTRYEGQKTLQTQDFSAILSDTTQPWVKKEQDKRDIEIYVAKRFNLQYISYKYKLTYNAINIKNDVAIVRLFESHNVIFKVIAPVVSKLSDLQHIFTLKRTKNSWTIYRDEYQDEFSQQFDHMTKANTQSRIDANYQAQQALIANESDDFVLPATTNTYNRTAAVYYAASYPTYGHRNLAYKSMYFRDGYGGDCTNYVSQILYAGAPKMNNTGVKGTGWWYNTKGTISPPIANTNDDTFSNSWSVVSYMFSFLTTNTSHGPYGIKTTICGILPGDVIQLNNGVQWFHEVVLQENLHIDYNCSNPVNYVIIGHDTDRFKYPLTYYTALYKLRYIHIMGWRP